MQRDVNQYYQTNHPGEVVVVGVDTWNGTQSQLRSFKNTTGATYPLLLNGSLASGGNVETLYGTYDNYIVINKQGIVRYHAADIWPHGNRYHLDEIRGAVDSLVTPTVDVGPAPDAAGRVLSASPNPFRVSTEIAFAAPGGPGRTVTVTVHDLAGRRIATLHDGPLAAGGGRVVWDGRDARGEPIRAGVYLVRATWPDAALTRRIVRVQ